MPRYHNIDGNRIQFTVEEEAAANAEIMAWDTGAVARAAESIQRKRKAAYQSEADHLHFEEARSEVTEGTWAAKVVEIKARFPKG